MRLCLIKLNYSQEVKRIILYILKYLFIEIYIIIDVRYKKNISILCVMLWVSFGHV